MSEIKAAQDARRRIDAQYAAGKLAVEDYAVQRLEVDTQISALEKERSRPGNLGLMPWSRPTSSCAGCSQSRTTKRISPGSRFSLSLSNWSRARPASQVSVSTR